MIGRFPLIERTGSTAYDYSGNGNDGTITGAGPQGTGLVDGPFDTAVYDFDGTDDEVSIPQGMFDATTGVTYSVWVKYDDTSGSQQIIDTDGENSLVALRKDTSNWKFNYTSSSFNAVATSTTSPDESSWYHITGLVRDDKTIEIYINGSKEDSVNNGAPIDKTFSRGNIGSADTTNYHNGQIFDARIYDRALTSQEVAALYQNPVNDAQFTSPTKTS